VVLKKMSGELSDTIDYSKFLEPSIEILNQASDQKDSGMQQVEEEDQLTNSRNSTAPNFYHPIYGRSGNSL